jgi:hypothetical protein
MIVFQSAAAARPCCFALLLSVLAHLFKQWANAADQPDK